MSIKYCNKNSQGKLIRFKYQNLQVHCAIIICTVRVLALTYLSLPYYVLVMHQWILTKEGK